MIELDDGEVNGECRWTFGIRHVNDDRRSILPRMYNIVTRPGSIMAVPPRPPPRYIFPRPPARPVGPARLSAADYLQRGAAWACLGLTVCLSPNTVSRVCPG